MPFNEEVLGRIGIAEEVTLRDMIEPGNKYHATDISLVANTNVTYNGPAGEQKLQNCFLSPEAIIAILREILNNDELRVLNIPIDSDAEPRVDLERDPPNLDITKQLEFSINRKDWRRCRINVGSCENPRGSTPGYGITIRILDYEVPRLANLGFPQHIYHWISQQRQGLALISGETGSGKSTTLAAMLNEMNHTLPPARAGKIITLEDPIEYVLEQVKCTPFQRQLGRDFSTFGAGIKYALRQNPRIILVGEMRDAETVKAALAAAETGHLVLSTLHTRGVEGIPGRIASFFGSDEERAIRYSLSQSLIAAATQQLITGRDNQKHLAAEYLIPGPGTPGLIAQGKDDKLLEQGFGSGSENLRQPMERAVRALAPVYINHEEVTNYL
tara:strand:- start:1299 stop:2459 length:1161 start_codon:yes stop_codon:yes gene_type:complete